MYVVLVYAMFHTLWQTIDCHNLATANSVADGWKRQGYEAKVVPCAGFDTSNARH